MKHFLALCFLPGALALSPLLPAARVTLQAIHVRRISVRQICKVYMIVRVNDNCIVGRMHDLKKSILEACCILSFCLSCPILFLLLSRS